MSEEKREEAEKKSRKKKDEESLEYCTTAPSAEHARGQDEDDPCDDSRAGE